MIRMILCGVALIYAAPSLVQSGEVRWLEPIENQVFQRSSLTDGAIFIRGAADNVDAKEDLLLEARVLSGTNAPAWTPLTPKWNDATFQAQLPVPAGGWYRVQLRASLADQVIALHEVAQVGVGDVYVVAGQSNSANYGEERQTVNTARVSSFDGQSWRIAHDPQPGAEGNGGSFMPPLGDSLVQHFDVPVGFLACGIGATSVREWLPQGRTFPNPPTIESRVRALDNGQWESDGRAYAMLIQRMKSLGPQGFRAVLWHQGESDANQSDASRTLPGALYREYLEFIIRASRTELGWNVPWFVAQASYHIPGDESSPDIRAAQASLWVDNIALAGPDSDSLKSEWRDSNGQGVHLNSKGLQAHAALWFEKLAPWIQQHHVSVPKQDRFDLAKRASETDPRAKEHPEIEFLFTNSSGKVLDVQHATVDTRRPPQGKIVIWLMDHNPELFDRLADYGLHAIQVHYANRWYSGLSKQQLNDGTSIGRIRWEAATGEDHSPAVDIPKPDGIKERALQFVKWLNTENPAGNWGQFLNEDQSDLVWDKVILSGISHGSTTAARFAKEQRVDRVVMFSGPRDNTESWQAFPSATPSNRFFGFTHVLDMGWTAHHYDRSWQMLQLPKYGEIVNVDQQPTPFQNTRQLITDCDVNNDVNRAHTVVVPGRSAAKREDGTYLHESVWWYLFNHPIQ